MERFRAKSCRIKMSPILKVVDVMFTTCHLIGFIALFESFKRYVFHLKFLIEEVHFCARNDQ